MALHLDDQDVVSNPLVITVRPPRDRAEEAIAQDLFSEEVGRILTVEGSRVLESGNDALREAADRLPDRRVALHARYALGLPLLGESRLLRVEGAERHEAMRFEGAPADPDAGSRQVMGGLAADVDAAAETFGHITLRRRAERAADRLAGAGMVGEAERVLDATAETLVRRGVLASVIEEVRAHRDRPRAGVDAPTGRGGGAPRPAGAGQVSKESRNPNGLHLGGRG